MVMKKRQLCGLLVLLCVFLTACSAAAETEPVSISFMHGWGGSGADHVGMRELFAEFEAENPDIHIVYDTSPDLGIVMEKAADMLAVDKTPNIISTNGNVQYVSNATKKGVALDLTPYLQEDATFASDVSPQILQALQEPDGAVYTLPDAVEYIGYWYNASLFQQAGITDTGTPEGTVVLPQTWEEFWAAFRSARWASSLARDWQLHPGMRCPLCKSRRLCAAGRMQSLRCPSLCVRWPMTRSAAQRRTSAGISLTARARSILTASGRIQSLRKRRQSRRSAMPRFPVFREKRSHTPILRPAMLSATTAQKGRSTPAFDS
mgnify:CR=1 FL=1